MRAPRVMSARLLAPAAPNQSRCPMATSMTSGVLGIPGRTLPASPKHIRNNASDKPMICSAVTAKLGQHVNHLPEPAVTAPVETEGDSRQVHNVGVFPLFRRRFNGR